ncbi:MAG: hypothetical protein EXR98_07645 [Gemmataceae bacterium]|nr:hypothetical protein [Gemmataceae bacterium]
MGKKKKATPAKEKAGRPRDFGLALDHSNAEATEREVRSRTRTLERVAMEYCWIDEDSGFLWIATAHKLYRISCLNSDTVYDLVNNALGIAQEMVEAAKNPTEDRSIKKVNTATLKRLVAHGRELNLEGTMPKQLEKRLDPNGWHTLSWARVFPVGEPHGNRNKHNEMQIMRIDALVKISGVPYRGDLDMTIDVWNAIPKMKKEPWNE